MTDAQVMPRVEPLNGRAALALRAGLVDNPPREP